MHYFLSIFMGLVFSWPLLADQLLGLPPLTIPNNNLQTPEKIALGSLLFHDGRFVPMALSVALAAIKVKKHLPMACH